MVNKLMDKIVFIGFGGHAKSVADSITAEGKYKIEGYTDLENRFCEYPYLGKDDVLVNCYKMGIKNAVLGVGFLGNSNIRENIVNKAKEIGFDFPVIIDPSSIIANDVIIEDGTYIGKRVVINTGTKVGKYCIINTGAIVEHECNIEDYSHIAVGTILCGKVSIGHHTMVGAGASVIQCRSIGNNSVIGAGAVVNQDLPNSCTAAGVPAKIINLK